MKKNSVLVTGCAGFIGSNFVTQFKRRFPKIKIIGIDDFSTGKREAVDTSITFYEGSIIDEKLLTQIFKKHAPLYVFHFAALPRVSYSVEHPTETTQVNVGGTVLLLEKAAHYKVRRFIFSSSCALYGDAKHLPTTEGLDLPNPISPYAVQKYVSESFCKMFSQLYGLDTVCLRYFNVFGPGQYGDSPYSTVISAWLEGLYFPKHMTPYLEGDGSQSRDFCFVDDVIQANIKVMRSTKKFNGEFFNIAQGERTNLKQIKALIEKRLDKKLNLEKRPPRIGDVRHTLASIKKANKWFGYKPSLTFERGLNKTIAWFESRNK